MKKEDEQETTKSEEEKLVEAMIDRRKNLNNALKKLLKAIDKNERK